MLRRKNIIVTAGGTTEYIDDVRVMTNISTGATGSIIASKLVAEGATVYFVHGKHSVLPGLVNRYPVMTAQDALESMRTLVGLYKIDAVVHAMAVSDFTFKRDSAIKCKSNDPQAFIDYMSRTITLNPKILSQVKSWRPETVLIGFKYEVGVTKDKLTELAHHSIESNGCDLVVTNDKKEIDNSGEHVTHFVYSQDNVVSGFKDETVIGNESIAEKIAEFLDKKLKA